MNLLDLLLNENGDATVYYHDTRGNWFEDSFNQKGIFKKQLAH